MARFTRKPRVEHEFRLDSRVRPWSRDSKRLYDCVKKRTASDEGQYLDFSNSRWFLANGWK